MSVLSGRAVDGVRHRHWEMLGPYMFGVLVTVLLAIARSSLDGALEDRSRFLLFLPGVVLVSWLGGIWPGALVLLGGALAGALVVPPTGESFVARPGDVLSVSLYLVSGSACIMIVRELRKTLEKLRVLNEQLESRVALRTGELGTALRDIQRFTYAVAHNMRSPLRAISSYSHMVREDQWGAGTGERSELLDRMGRAAMRMSELIDDLLSYARLCGNEVSPEEVDISAIASNSIALTLQSYDVLEAEVRVQPGLQAKVDKRLIAEAIGCIVDNSVKYRRADRGLAIDVSATESEAEIVLAIKDNGIGFDMSYVQKVFEPFERLHLDDVYPGTGIGLAVAARITEKHHGRIWAESCPNMGTAIFLSLPPPVGNLRVAEARQRQANG